MILDISVTNEESLLLSSKSFINAINICNIGATNASVSLFKIKKGDTYKFYLVKDITVKANYTFIGEDIQVLDEDDFYIGVASGSCVISVNYT